MSPFCFEVIIMMKMHNAHYTPAGTLGWLTATLNKSLSSFSLAFSSSFFFCSIETISNIYIKKNPNQECSKNDATSGSTNEPWPWLWTVRAWEWPTVSDSARIFEHFCSCSCFWDQRSCPLRPFASLLPRPSIASEASSPVRIPQICSSKERFRLLLRWTLNMECEASRRNRRPIQSRDCALVLSLTLSVPSACDRDDGLPWKSFAAFALVRLDFRTSESGVV